MIDRRPVTGYGLLTTYPLASWLWRDGAGVLLSDPLAALRERGDLEAGFAIREREGFCQAIPLLDETLTPAYLLTRRGRAGRHEKH